MESKKVDIFTCKQCGYCCQGETTVSLDGPDVAHMLAFLKMEKSEVEKKYWNVTGKIIQMKTVDGHCIFYNKGCTIHSGKPWRCSQWPLHPSILSDRANFETIRNSCPGISRGLNYEEFCSRFRALLKGEKNNSNCRIKG